MSREVVAAMMIASVMAANRFHAPDALAESGTAAIITHFVSQSPDGLKQRDDVTNQDVLNALRDLEKELLQPEVRSSAQRLEPLLHPDFEEFGRSGRRYDRAAVLAEFSRGGTPAHVEAGNISVTLLSSRVALITYESAHVGRHGERFRQSLRSSVWVRTARGWLLRFHQGTPIDE